MKLNIPNFCFVNTKYKKNLSEKKTFPYLDLRSPCLSILVEYDPRSCVLGPGTLRKLFPFSKVNTPEPVFKKGLRLSQVVGLNVVLKLRLLSQLSFVLNLYSQKGT